MNDYVTPGLYATQLDTDKATKVYVNRLRRKARRVKGIGEELLSLLCSIEDEDSYGPDALASIEDLGSELHDLAMIAHTTDFKHLHHVLHS
jgi:hypothetical protein